MAVLTGVDVISVADPTKPERIAHFATSSTPLAMAVSGDRAYVVGTHLHVLDISNPMNITALGEVAFEGTATDIWVVDGRAYVTAELGSLQVFDVSNPEEPVLLGMCDTLQRAYGVSISGQHAYVAAGSFGLRVVDISEPARPVRIGNGYETTGSSLDISVSGDHIYVADRSMGMRVINVSDPAVPQLVANYRTREWEGGSSLVEIVGNHAYLYTPPELEIINIEDPAEPGRLGGFWGARAGSLVVTGGYAYTAYGWSRCGDDPFCEPMVHTGGFDIIDVRDPLSPVRAGNYEVVSQGPVEISDIAVSGDHAYVGHSASAFGIIDITDIEQPTRAGYLLLGGTWRLKVVEDHLYCLVDGSTFRVVDVQNPLQPVAQGAVEIPGARSLAISGKYAYIGGSQFLKVVDISDPANPMIAGSYETKGEGLNLVVEGNYVYVADGPWGVQIFRVDPALRLTAELLGAELRLKWPSAAAGYLLQGTSTLSPAEWADVAGTPVEREGSYEVNLPANGPARFYRLHNAAETADL